MKKTLMAIFCVIGLVLTVASAQATPLGLSYGDSHYVGSITPDTPAGYTDETYYLQSLTNLTIGGSASILTLNSNTNHPNYVLLNRIDSTLTALPSVPTTIYQRINTAGVSQYTASNDGIYYILGKYGTNAWVWEIAATAGTVIDLPDTMVSNGSSDGNGISHFSVWYTPSTTPVPEPGTMVLLGAGMLGLAIFGKRRMNKE